MCFDVSHYGLSMGVLNREFDRKKNNFTNKDKLTSLDLIREGMYPIYPSTISKQPSPLAAVKALHKKEIIGEVQLSDYGQIWKRTNQNSPGNLIEEGLNFLEGTGGMGILNIALFIATNAPKIPLAFDVEVNNYTDMKEQISAVLLFIDYMNDHESLHKKIITNPKKIVQEYNKKAQLF